MAVNIDEFLNKIESAVRGEEVRDAILDVLRILNDSEKNASHLNGHPANYFAKQSDMDEIIPFDNVPTYGSTKGIRSGAVYEILASTLIAIDTIIGEEGSGDETVVDRLNDIYQIKKNIRAAIISRSGTFDKNTPFTDYASIISSIPITAEVNVQSITISENGDYEASSGNAYNPITVNVKPKTASKTISTTGTFYAKDDRDSSGDPLDGYSSVSVSISGLPSGGSSQQSLTLTTKNISGSDLDDKGKVTMKASDDNAIGYSSVTVDASSAVTTKEISVSAKVGETQEFDARELDDMLGYSKVIVTITKPTGYFNVTFMNGQEFLWETTVPAFGAVTYAGPTIVPPTGQYFAGWNPQPVNVVGDITCRAIFSKTQPVPGDITDTWEQIINVRGAGYEIGSIKTLYIMPVTLGNIVFNGGSFAMKKVSEGGDAGSISTWVATTVISLPMYDEGQLSGDRPLYNNDYLGWNNSTLRRFLNNEFIDAISKTSIDPVTYQDSHLVANAINQVAKTSVHYDKNTNSAVVKTTNDKIWVPSEAEFKGSHSNEISNYNLLSMGIPLNANSTNRTLKNYNYYNIKGTESIVFGANYSYSQITSISYDPNSDPTTRYGTGNIVFGFCL